MQPFWDGRADPGPVSSCGHGVHLAYAWRNEIAKVGHYKRTASRSSYTTHTCLWQHYASPIHRQFAYTGDYRALDHTCMRPQYWMWIVIPPSASIVTPKKKKRKKEDNNSKLCFQTFTSHCKAKPENLCCSSMCMVPPTRHLTTEGLADKCLWALAILAEPFPERKTLAHK